MFGLGSFWDTHMNWDSWNEVLTWYPWSSQYPVHLRREFDDRRFYVTPEDAQPIEPRQYGRLLRQVKDYARASVARYKLPYHNEHHFEQMAQTATMLFDRMYGGQARRGPLIAIRQAIEIAAWLHDCHHSGCTLRGDSIKPLYRPELGKNVSAEYVSAVAANDFLAHAGLPIQWRAFVVNCILATTFGGKVAQERGIKNVPVIVTPRTPYFALMRAADVWPIEDIYEATQKGIDVNYHEIPATGQINDPMELLQAQLSFQDYRLLVMRNLDTVCGKPITAKGQAVVKQLARQYRAALDGTFPRLVEFTTLRMS